MTFWATRTRVCASLALVTSLLLSLHVGAQRNHKREAREEIVSLEEQWRSAQLNDDVPAMDKLLSEDFLGITSSGQVVTKAQQLDRMRTRSLMMTTLEISDLKIKLLGPIAVVTSLANLEGSADGRPLVGSFRYTHVFQRLPSGTWQITSFEATRIHGSGHRHASPDGDQVSR